MVVEVHDLRTEMQMAADFKNPMRVTEQLVNCQTQFIEIQAGRIAQGIKKASIHLSSLSQALPHPGNRRNRSVTFHGSRSATRLTG